MSFDNENIREVKKLKKSVGILIVLLFLSLSAWADEAKYEPVSYNLLLQNWDTQTINGLNISSVRRAENKLTFKWSPDWSLVVMADPAKQLTSGKDNSYLQDAYFQWKMNKQWQWKIGQFKIPVSEEGLRSSAHLDTIERAQFNLGSNKFGDLRELGTMMEYQDAHVLAQFGVFSGDPVNQSVGGTLKEGAARLVFSPDGHFHFGGSLSRGSRRNVDAPLTQPELSNKNGIEFQWEDKPWLFETEYVRGRLDVPTVSGAGIVTAVTPTIREGWYAKLRYDVAPNLQTVIRDDALFTNVYAPGNGERDITAGFNWWFQKKPQEVFLQLNYVNRRSFSATPVQSLWRTNLEIFF